MRKELLLFSLFLLGIGFEACRKPADSCEDVVCVHGGCVDATCLCDTGFEGADCSLESRAKFLGDWEGGDICLSGSALYPVQVLGGVGIREIRIVNVFQRPDTVLALIEGKDLLIELQAFGQWTIEGTGQIDTNASPVSVSIDYEVDYGGGLKENCLLTLLATE